MWYLYPDKINKTKKNEGVREVKTCSILLKNVWLKEI